MNKGGGGVALMHVFVLEHIGSLSYRTAWWIFTKLDRDEVLMTPHLCLGFSANSSQGGAKIGQWRFLSQKDFFFRCEGYSKNPNTRQWSKSIWKKRCYFWFKSEVNFLSVLDVFLDFKLVILVYFNAFSIDLYAVSV